MRAAQLYIKQTNKFITLGSGGDFPFTLSKSIAEVQDIQKRNKTSSKTFKIPASAENVQALGYAHVIGTDIDALNVYKQQCLIIVNGNVIDDGYVYILKAKRNTNALEFECQFVGGNESWVVALQSLKMSDMTTNTSGTVLQLAYTDANILSRVLANPRTMADPSYVFVNPYMYKFSDSDANNYDSTETYNGTSRKARGTDFWPAFRLDFIIDGIFGTATNPLVQQVFGFDAFKLDSDFLTGNATHGFFDNIYYSDRSQDDYPNVTFGTTEDWRFFLPADVTMLDFFMNVCKTFNLVFSFDGITLKVEPRENWTSWNGTTYNGFYSGTVDWSDKVSVDQEIQYKSGNSKRQVRLSWGTETYPIDDNMYPFITDDTVNQPEVRYIVDLDSNNEEGITDIQLPFNTSLSKFYQAKFDRVRTRGFIGPITEDEANQATSITFDPDNTFANRLFVFKSGSAPMGMPRHVNAISIVTSRYTGIEAYLFTPTWRQWVYKQADGTLSTQLGYPFIYNCMTINPYVHTDETLALGDGSSLSSIVTKVSDFDTILNVDVADVSVTRQPSDATDLGRLTDITSNDIDDVNLGIYNANTVTMVDGLYERFWKTTLDKLITTRTLITKILLTRAEYVSLDFTKYYTLMGQRFIINKIKDFDPMLDEQMVEVELLAVDAFASSQEIGPAILTAIASVGTQQNVLTGINNTNTNQWPVELKRGRYISSLGQATNADNQDWTVTGLTQSGASLTTSATPLVAFNNTADFDPYGRGQAAGICRLTDDKFFMVSPDTSVGNVFKVCTYTGGTSNVTIDFTINDGDTTNFIDRGTQFIVINEPSANVYTLAATGLTRGNATPYVRVYDLNISTQAITQRGILFPRGASSSPGHGGAHIINLGEVGGKKCFASFYFTGGSSFSGLVHYAVYEYNTSTNTLVEVVGDTLFKSGTNQDGLYYFADFITNGRGLMAFHDRTANTSQIHGVIWNGTTFTVGAAATFGSSSKQPLRLAIRKYFDGISDSSTQFLLAGGLFNSGADTSDFILFPATYDASANTWDVSKFDTASSKVVLVDPSNPTTSDSYRGYNLITQVDKDNGAMLTAMITRANTSFRGTIANTFITTNT